MESSILLVSILLLSILTGGAIGMIIGYTRKV